MDIKHTISSTEARQNFAKVLEKVGESGARYTITINGRPKVTLINSEELEALQETLDILSDAEAMKRIRVAKKELAAGESISLDDLLIDGAIS